MRLLWCLVLAACTSQTVYQDGNVIQRTITVGAPRLPALEGAVTIRSTVAGIGIMDGVVIGYAEREEFRVPLDCGVVLVVKNRPQVEWILGLLGPDVCMKGPLP